MQLVAIYGYEGCRWCDAAKAYFRSLAIPFVDHDIKADPQAFKALDELAPGFKTVPQIFIGQFHLGGFDALKVAAEDGRLKDLLIGESHEHA